MSSEMLRQHWAGLKATKAIPELLKLLNHEYSLIQEAAAEALGRLQAENAVPDLCRLLKEGGFRIVRNAALEALVQLRAEEALPELHKRLDALDFPDQEEQEKALEALVRLQSNEKALLELQKRLNDQHLWLIRPKIAELLARLQPKEGPKELLKLLNEKNPDIRAKAAEALGRLRAEDAVPDLRKCLKDQVPSVRLKAAEALGRLQPKEGVPELINLLHERGPAFRAMAAEALGHLRAEDAVDAVPPLLELLKNDREDTSVRAKAAEALGRLQANAAVPHLLKLLNALDADIRVKAAEALGRLQAKDAMPQLLKLLNDQQIFVEGNDATDVSRAVKRHKAEARVVSEKAVDALERLHPAVAMPELVKIAETPYECTTTPVQARWFLHYLGGGEPDVEILCKYLTRPQAEPTPVSSRKEATPALKALTRAWDDGKSSLFKEDVAKWWSKIITEQVKDWTREDVDETLKPIRKRLEAPGNQTGRGYLSGIEGVIERVLRPSEMESWMLTLLKEPWVRSLLAFSAINLIAILLFVFRRGRLPLENWLPFLGYACAGAGSLVANVLAEPHLNPWLLAGLLVGELVVAHARRGDAGSGRNRIGIRRERQTAGIQVARKKGSYKGRKKGTTKSKPDRAKELRDKGLKVAEIAQALGVSERTAFRYLDLAE